MATCYYIARDTDLSGNRGYRNWDEEKPLAVIVGLWTILGIVLNLLPIDFNLPWSTIYVPYLTYIVLTMRS